MAQRQLWEVFAPVGGRWRGIAHVPNGNLRLRDEWAHLDARRRFAIDLRGLVGQRSVAAGAAVRLRRHHVGHQESRATARCSARECVPETPVGACMVSSEGTCRIWHEYGGNDAIMTVARGCTQRIAMKHGAGGRSMRRLIEEVFLDARAVRPRRWTMARRCRSAISSLIVTTDSHVIQPLFFPGGDIGRLSVAGTVNDLAMMGATEPLGLTCGVILEEGFPVETSRASRRRSGRRARKPAPRSSPAIPR